MNLQRLREALAWWDTASYMELTEAEEHYVRELGNAARRLLEPDHEAALAELRAARPEWTPYIGDAFVIRLVVDAALIGEGP